MVKRSNHGRSAAAVVTQRCLVLLVACCAWGPSKSANAEDIRQLAQSKDWELVRVEDPFAEKSVQCQIRTRTAQAGGRRERPLIIFDLTSQRIAVRPDMTLQGSVELNRALKGDTGDQGGRQDVLIQHGIRVDGGELHSIQTRDSGSGSIEAHFDGAVYAALAREAQSGTTMYYLWSVASSRKAFNFPLDGLRELFPTARQECTALARP